ncbi:hypothetical protein LPUS_11775 [Lasallia pustulata]|uniref:Uncharacterized protein n=1 Tax=Lasallia pustulata TaxID=136370 RepID=A0A1W5DDI6_9LECA|nr:hypothetical protein LPUS_11775 [Lasallia pustulata]
MIRPAYDGSKTQARRRATFDPRFQRKDTEPARRRDLFLKRVKQSGDDRRWESRAEQILRRDFLAQQRDWEADLARSAPNAPAASDDEDMDMEKAATLGQAQSADNLMEEVLSREEQELEALISLMERDDRAAKDREGATADYGSEEEDYDRLFMEVFERPERRHPSNTPRAPQGTDVEMDITMD